MTISVEHDKEQHQFFSIVEGKKALLDYTALPDGKTLDYTHTFTPPALRGRGIAGQIVKFALDYARAHHYKVIPTCPFVRSYIEDHPEYKSLQK